MNKKILNLAIPNIISNITVPLLGIVDIALLGHLGSEVYIGAIAIGTVIFNFLYWGFGFLRLGTTGFTAQNYGERNFNLSDEEKIALFRQGANAAADFFLGKEEAPLPAEQEAPEAKTRSAKGKAEAGFDWQYYKRYRNVRKRRMGF